MTVTFNLAPIPRWYFADNQGRPLGAGKMFTYSALNKSEEKAVFQDPNGFIAWTNPVLWDLNGMQGPFYWEFDSSNPEDLYYIEIYDKNNNLIFTQDFFGAPGNGGGGSITYVPLNNLITNGTFLNHVGAPITPLPAGHTLVAPGAHEAFQFSDVQFFKDVSGATDTISFPLFPQGTNPLTGDNTPVDYFQYTSNVQAGETSKYLQFPIQPKVKSMENQVWTFTIWASSVSGTDSITLDFVQYFGDGGSPSLPNIVPIATLSLTTTWAPFRPNVTIPSTATAILGTCGNDGNYLRINFNPAVTTGVNLTKVSAYQGNIPPGFDFQTNDMINSVIHCPRVGDIKTTYSTFSSIPPVGWLPMDDGSIGSSTSGATTRANQDAFYLYQTLWDNVNNLYAPVTGGRGSTAIADFAANKSMLLTRMLGRTMAGVITPQVTQTFTVTGPPTTTITVASTAHFYTGVPVALTTSGTLPNTTTGPLVPGQTYYARMLSTIALALAPTPEQAIAGTGLITFTDTGTGTQFITVGSYQLGQFLGKEYQVIADMPNHTHTIINNPPTFAQWVDPPDGTLIVNGGGADARFDRTTPALSSVGGGSATGLMQPTTYVNVFIKL